MAERALLRVRAGLPPPLLSLTFNRVGHFGSYFRCLADLVSYVLLGHTPCQLAVRTPGLGWDRNSSVPPGIRAAGGPCSILEFMVLTWLRGVSERWCSRSKGG